MRMPAGIEDFKSGLLSKIYQLVLSEVVPIADCSGRGVTSLYVVAILQFVLYVILYEPFLSGDPFADQTIVYGKRKDPFVAKAFVDIREQGRPSGGTGHVAQTWLHMTE